MSLVDQILNEVKLLDACYAENKDNQFEYWRGFAALAKQEADRLRGILAQVSES